MTHFLETQSCHQHDRSILFRCLEVINQQRHSGDCREQIANNAASTCDATFAASVRPLSSISFLNDRNTPPFLLILLSLLVIWCICIATLINSKIPTRDEERRSAIFSLLSIKPIVLQTSQISLNTNQSSYLIQDRATHCHRELIKTQRKLERNGAWRAPG